MNLSVNLIWSLYRTAKQNGIYGKPNVQYIAIFATFPSVPMTILPACIPFPFSPWPAPHPQPSAWPSGCLVAPSPADPERTVPSRDSDPEFAPCPLSGTAGPCTPPDCRR